MYEERPTDATDQSTQDFIRPGAKAFIVHEGKVLFIEEELPNGDIFYDVPGGGIDFGERLEDGLKREVFEEVGLEVELEKIVGSWKFVIPSKRVEGVQVHILSVGYQCRLAGDGEPIIDLSNNPADSEDIFGFDWLSKADVLENRDKYIMNEDMLQAFMNVEI